jgi:hypothetical protein
MDIVLVGIAYQSQLHFRIHNMTSTSSFCFFVENLIGLIKRELSRYLLDTKRAVRSLPGCIKYCFSGIILMYFKIKNTLKNNRYHILKHPIISDVSTVLK